MERRVARARQIGLLVAGAMLLGLLAFVLQWAVERHLASAQLLVEARAALVDAPPEASLRAALTTALAAAEEDSRRLLRVIAIGLPSTLCALVLGWLLLRREVASRKAAEAAHAAAGTRLQASVEQLTQVSYDMQRLSAYAGLLQTCETTEEALDVTRVCFAALLPGCAGLVYLVRGPSGHALLATQWGHSRLQSAPRIEPAQCWGWRRAQPYATDSANAALRCSHVRGDDARTATLCLPLIAHGNPFGLLYLDGPEPLRGERLAASAAEQLSLALANLHLRESLREQSVRDALTGLYNRRHLEHVLEFEAARSRERGGTLALLMLDVDHFKSFNDRHGHAAGDALLSALGRVLAECFRQDGIACRYGGEEFSVVLPDTDLATALARAEGVRAAIAGLVVHHDGARLPRVTASIGLATLPGSVELLDELQEAADRALYQAKSRGRDRVVVSGAPAGSGTD